MKHTSKASLCIIALLAAPLTTLHADDSFTVHEWGTFTAVVGSDGLALPWWTPTLEGPAELPEFVSTVPSFSKSSGSFMLRMETPVIYFYPAHPMEATITAGFPGGRITEAFPAGAADFKNLRNGRHEWRINLLPSGAQNNSALPPVGQRGAHYRHAREVPDAWIVRSSQPHGPTVQDCKSKAVPQVEKFIFYRGAGAASLPMRISAHGTSELDVGSPAEFQTTAFVVRVQNGQLSWNSTVIRPEPTKQPGWKQLIHPVPDAEHSMKMSMGLNAALAQALGAAGLTMHEARAMVATWADTWFKDEGLRVLYLLPPAWVDATLPLKIEPKPSALKRVFVARAEILTRAQEQSLADTLDSALSDEARVERINSLRLGRFLSAAVERAVQVKEAGLRENYRRASIAIAKQKTLTPELTSK